MSHITMRELGAACRISVARLRPAESDVRGVSSTRSKTVGAVLKYAESVIIFEGVERGHFIDRDSVTMSESNSISCREHFGYS